MLLRFKPTLVLSMALLLVTFALGQTPTFTPTQTIPPTSTFTPTRTFTPTGTFAPTNTQTATFGPTNTPTFGATSTPTFFPTSTFSPTSTNFPTSTPTSTPPNTGMNDWVLYGVSIVPTASSAPMPGLWRNRDASGARPSPPTQNGPEATLPWSY